MEATSQSQSRARRLLTIAYAPPVHHGRRSDTPPVYPGWLFDAFVSATFLVLGASYVLFTFFVP